MDWKQVKDYYENNEKFVELCGVGKLSTVRDHYNFYKTDIHFYNNSPYMIAKWNNNKQICDWLLTLDTVESFSGYTYEHRKIERTLRYYHNKFYKIFLTCDLDYIKEYYEKNVLSLEFVESDIIIDAIKKGKKYFDWVVSERKNLKAQLSSYRLKSIGLIWIKWIHESNVAEQISYDKKYVLKKAIYNNDTKFIDWFLSIDNGINKDMKIYFSYDDIFGLNIEGLKYVYTILPSDNIIITDINNIIRDMITRGYYEKLVFLLQKYDYDIHKNNDRAIIVSCEKNHIDIAQFLFENYEFDQKVIDKCFYTSLLNLGNQMQMIKYLSKRASKKCYNDFLKTQVYFNRFSLIYSVIKLINEDKIILNDNEDFDLLILILIKNINESVKEDLKCFIRLNLNSLKYLEKSTIKLMIKNNIFDSSFYVYVPNKYLSRDEKTIKMKFIKAGKIINNFMYKKYYGPGGIFFSKQLAKI